MKGLSRDERMLLMKFVCSFAWADLEIHEKEREFISKLVRQLELDDAERAQVESWLEVPPRPEDVDPAAVPRAHRELFVDSIKAIIASDGYIDRDEAENFALLEMLTR
jgi:uncharacterized membrane protein YebE (DUF533 family)